MEKLWESRSAVKRLISCIFLMAFWATTPIPEPRLSSTPSTGASSRASRWCRRDPATSALAPELQGRRVLVAAGGSAGALEIRW